mgnify:CR=1 FL=1
MNTVALFGDSNTLLLSAVLAQVTPPTGWAWHFRGQNAQGTGPGLVHLGGLLTNATPPTVAFLGWGGWDAGGVATATPNMTEPPCTVAGAARNLWDAATYLNSLGTHAVIARGVGCLTVPHPAVTPDPADLNRFHRQDTAYLDIAAAVSHWPHTVSYRQPATDPKWWTADHVHVSAAGAMAAACRVVQYLRTNGFWPAG